MEKIAIEFCSTDVSHSRSLTLNLNIHQLVISGRNPYENPIHEEFHLQNIMYFQYICVLYDKEKKQI